MGRAHRLIAVVVAIVLPSLSAAVAGAIPLTQPDGTAIVNGPVRTIAQAGSVVWLGGAFTEATDPGGGTLEVDNLVAIEDTTGMLDTSVHVPSVTLAGGTPIVYDSSLGPDGVLYFAGEFSAVDGSPRQNVAALDPSTGSLLPFAAASGAARSVLATSSHIYVGSGRLLSFELDGTSTPGFSPPVAGIDPRLRSHGTTPNVRDIVPLDPNTLVVACQCDWFTDRHGKVNVKAVVEIDAGTGDVRDWAPAGGLPPDSAAFGISVIVHDSPSGDPTVYLAAGGSDFTAAYDASSGAQHWRTDTSGSSQAVVWYEGRLIVGGHFDWTQRPGGNPCGSNDAPNLACIHSPKLVAMDPATGHVILDGSGDPWNPGICCKYNGVWALLADANGGALHVGGEFTQVGGTWVGSGLHWTLSGEAHQDYYGRLSDVATPNRSLSVAIAGTGAGAIVSAPSGISCGEVCEASFRDGTSVTLTAAASTGSDFSGWSGDCTGLGDCVLAMDADQQVTATFTLSPVTGCGRIAFVSDRSGNNDIFTMNEDGSELTQLTTDPASDASPAWSPDCSQIVFASTRSGRSHLYVMGADGSDVRALTSGASWDDTQPAWSSTGSLIAFVSTRSGNADIYVMTPDGENVRAITRDPHADRQPTFGAGGTKIAFASNRSGMSQIYSIGVDGTGLKALTKGSVPSAQPSWSRGGARIAFVGTMGGTPQIWIMTWSGSGQMSLTSEAGTVSHPSWSRSGGRLAYAVGSDTGPSQLRIVALDGSGSKPTGDPAGGSSPQWS